MAQATFVHDGGSIDYTPSADVVAGEVVVLGGVALVAKTAIASGKLGALATAGVFDFAKQSGVTFDVGDAIYWDNINKYANKVTTGTYLGVAIAAAAGGDETVRCKLDALANALGVGNLSNVGDGSLGLPVLVRKLATVAAAGDVTVLASAPRKLRVVDAWLIARDTNAANVKLHSGTAGVDDITAAVAKGTTNAAVVRWTSIVDAKADIAAGGTLKVNFSAAGSIEVYVLVLPVE